MICMTIVKSFHYSQSLFQLSTDGTVTLDLDDEIDF